MSSNSNFIKLYSIKNNYSDIGDLLNEASQNHPLNLPDTFLEKDAWVTEVLHILYDSDLFNNMNVAFKGGTCLSKCWNAIERFSEDIDLSIHWSDLMESKNEYADWAQSIKNASQQQKFRKRQKKLLENWIREFIDNFNTIAQEYKIDDFKAEYLQEEQVQIKYPSATGSNGNYVLDYILLEFGGRNRGKPTEQVNVTSYLSMTEVLDGFELPTANVMSYDKHYIMWEKLTALHQYCHTKNLEKLNRSSRHWYDVFMLIDSQFCDPLSNPDAAIDVVTMKQQRWVIPGVDYTDSISGQIQLVPNGEVLKAVKADYIETALAGMFYDEPPEFEDMATAILNLQNLINQHYSV
jgi:hypothetical protein